MTSPASRLSRSVVSYVCVYADQFTEFAAQVSGMDLDDADVLVIQATTDGTIIGKSDGHDDVIVRKDVAS